MVSFGVDIIVVTQWPRRGSNPHTGYPIRDLNVTPRIAITSQIHDTIGNSMLDNEKSVEAHCFCVGLAWR